MMIKRTSILGWSLLWLTCSAAFAWTPSECKRDFAQSWAAHEKRVRNAEVGSPLYAPAPFPKTDDQVLEDLRYAYLMILSDDDLSKQPPEAKLVYDGLQNGDLKFMIDRVENWSVDRCLPRRQKSFRYLVRIFLADGKAEVARVTVNQDGLLGSWNYRPAEEARRKLWADLLRSPSETRDRLARDLGIETGQGELVQTTGTLRCPSLEPCVALRSAQGILLVTVHGEVFDVRDNAQRFSRREATHPATRDAVAEGRRTGDERLVSLGDEFAVAHRIGRIE